MRDEIIHSHMRLCMSIVAKYSGRYSYIVDDLVGAAMIGLCQAVDWAPTRMYDNNITPYIYQTCERFVKDFIENRLVIHIPYKEFMSVREEMGLLQPLVTSVDSWGTDENEYVDEYDMLTEQATKQIEDHPLLFQELVESLQLCHRDQTVVTMLLEGYNNVEIAERLGMHRMNVTYIRRRLQEKLERILHENNRPSRSITGNDDRSTGTN